MLGYVKHQRSLVSQGNKPTTTSPSPPVTAVTTAPIVSLPSLSFSEDHIRLLMHSMFQDFMQSGSLGINQLSTAPPAVPDSAAKITEAAGGLSSVTPVEVLISESPGVVLPTTQEDRAPPPPLSLSLSYLYVYLHVHVFRVLINLRLASFRSPVPRVARYDVISVLCNFGDSYIPILSSVGCIMHALMFAS